MEQVFWDYLLRGAQSSINKKGPSGSFLLKEMFIFLSLPAQTL